MRIDIYKSKTDGKKYLSVPSGTNVNSISFPQGFDPDLSELSPFSSDMDINHGEHRAALDPDDIISQIEQKGYATHVAQVLIS